MNLRLLLTAQNRKVPRFELLFLVLCLSPFYLWGNTQLDDSPALWSLSGNVPKTVYRKGVASQNSVPVNLHESSFAEFKIKKHFTLPVFHTSVNVQLESSQKTGEMIIWRARNVDAPQLPTTLIFVRENSVSAWIPTRKGTYRLKDGKLFKEVKMGGPKSDIKIPPTSDLPTPTALNGKSIPLSGPGVAKSLISENRIQAAGDNKYRVLFVVTNEFVSSFPDTENTINEYIAANNAIYEASGMNVELVNAGLFQSDLEQFTTDQILDNLSGSTSTDSTDGDISNDLLEPIWEARLTNRADFITVFVNDLEDGLCGQGWLNGDEDKVFNYNFAVNVTAAFTVFSGNNSQSCGIDTLGHELGHNMGLGHSLQQGSTGTVFDWGRGYGVNDQFTTVMAYPQEFGSAEGLAFFSSPDLTCLDSFPCGVDGSQSDGADAVSAVNEVKDQISLIHNDETTLSISDALSDFNTELQNCVLAANTDIITNEQLRSVNCPSVQIDSFTGMEKLPKLVFVSVFATDTDLTPFQNIPNIDVLDFRSSRVTSLRPVAHLIDQLRFLQFSASDMSCQDVNVVQSYSHITDGNSVLNASFCDDLSTDSEDFDGDGVNNLNDTDDDNDGIDDIKDHLPFDASNANDIDADGVVDGSDAFPYNDGETLDTDNDGVGNNSDSDDDNDGVADGEDCAPLDNTLTTDCSGNSNQAPSITGTPDTTIAEDSQYSFTPTASDSDGDTLTFSIQNQPGWTGFNSANGNLSGTPDNDDVGIYGNVVISVSDGELSDSLEAFSITVTNVNDAPTISGTPSTAVAEGNAYLFEPTASDVDEGDTLSFSIQNQPSWSDFSAASGALSGTPQSSDIGTYSNIVISVSDGQLQSNLSAFSITVTDVNQAPEISGTPATTVAEDAEYSFMPAASDADGDTLTFFIENRPAWASFSTNSGLLTGTPTNEDVGEYTSIIISVSDGEFTSSLDAFSITVSNVNDAPLITGSPATNVSEGGDYEFVPTAFDEDGDTLTFSIQNQPGWTEFSTASGALTGSPANDDVGTHSNIIITVSDGQAQANLAAFSIVVDNVNQAPVISGTPATTVTALALYSFTPEASDVDGDSLTFTIENQPSWSEFDSDTGALSGTPEETDVGDFDNIIISVSDGELSANLEAFSITVSSSENSDEIKFVAYDYDGDGKADVGVRRASNFFQYILNSRDEEIQRVEFGKNAGDITVSGDFDGDKIADVAVRRPSNKFWYIKNSSDGEIQRFNFGKQDGDIPVPADYDGDGITDIAIRRPSNFTFYILNSSDNETQRIRFGLNADDIPVPADYDGDGKADVAVRRQSNQHWYILNSSNGETQRIHFGKQSTDIPIPADYDGDGKADVAVRRGSNFMFYIRNSSDEQIQRIRFGINKNDIPIPADYDGDGKADVAVRRPSTQFQYILRSTDGEIERIRFGRNTADMPLAAPIMERLNVEVSTEVQARPDGSEEFESVKRTTLSLTESILEKVR